MCVLQTKCSLFLRLLNCIVLGSLEEANVIFVEKKANFHKNLVSIVKQVGLWLWAFLVQVQTHGWKWIFVFSSLYMT